MPTTFISRAKGFQMTLETGGLPLRDTNGLVVGSTPGKRIQFVRGTFTATPQEARRLGYENTDDLIHAMKHMPDGNPRPTYGVEFYEMGNAPDAQHPPVDKLLADIADASVRRNANKLRGIVRREEETHKREVILTSAKAALGVLGDEEIGKKRPGRPHPVKPEDEASNDEQEAQAPAEA